MLKTFFFNDIFFISLFSIFANQLKMQGEELHLLEFVLQREKKISCDANEDNCEKIKL